MTHAQALPASSARAPRQTLHISLWVVQVLLAAVFLMAGGTKLTAPVETLQTQMAWVAGGLGGAVRYIGFAEVLGAVGLLAPAALRILPMLTPAAAAGLTALMVGATGTHLVRGEFAIMPVTLTLAALAAFVAWGRGSRAPIAPRG